MSKFDELTIAIVSYKYGHLVSHCIESVLCQKPWPMRILVVDDGVGDVQQRYQVDYLIRPKNLGIIENFNDILFNQVSTKRLMILGADNWLRPDAMKWMYDQKYADIVSTDMALVGREVYAPDWFGYKWWKFGEYDIEQENYIHGSSIYNVDLARKVGGYEPSGRKKSEEDWMLWRKMLKAGASHRHVSQPLLYYRRHDANYQGN